jgi:hypothetical protein
MIIGLAISLIVAVWADSQSLTICRFTRIKETWVHYLVDPLVEPELLDPEPVDGLDVEGDEGLEVDGLDVEGDEGLEVDGLDGFRALVRPLVTEDNGLEDDVVVVVVDGGVDANVGVGFERLTLIGLNVD